MCCKALQDAGDIGPTEMNAEMFVRFRDVTGGFCLGYAAEVTRGAYTLAALFAAAIAAYSGVSIGSLIKTPAVRRTDWEVK